MVKSSLALTPHFSISSLGFFHPQAPRPPVAPVSAPPPHHPGAPCRAPCGRSGPHGSDPGKPRAAEAPSHQGYHGISLNCVISYFTIDNSVILLLFDNITTINCVILLLLVIYW